MIDRILLIIIAIGVWITVAVEIAWVIAMQAMGEMM